MNSVSETETTVGHALTEDDLALVVGGTDGPPTNAGDHNGNK
jgi:hypothetical protein